jgi:hypothetical protein
MSRMSAFGKIARLAVIILSSIAGSLSAVAEDLGSTVPISDQNYIATPSANGVGILLDVFPNEAALKAAPGADRVAIGETLARRTVELYLKELEDADKKDIKTAEVTIVYIRQRDEYDKPMFSAMTEVGKVVLALEDGKISGPGKPSEMKF